MASFSCPYCSAAIESQPEQKSDPHGAFQYWRCRQCGQSIPADIDGIPLFDGDVVELVVQDDPGDFDALVGDHGTIALANHALQEGGPLVTPWGGFYSPSALRLVRRCDDR